MKIFGITGGSGSGKTSVSSMLREMGVHIIDTDVIAHEVVEAGKPCLCELTEYFGTEILNSDDSLDRKKLASIAFSDDEKKLALNRITHKYIKEAVLDDISKTDAELVGIDGAVIIGSEIEPICEFIISVVADNDVRLRRIIQRDALTEQQAVQRLEAQPKDEFYKENSSYIIYNNGSTEELIDKVCELYKKIKEV